MTQLHNQKNAEATNTSSQPLMLNTRRRSAISQIHTNPHLRNKLTEFGENNPSPPNGTVTNSFQ